MSFLVHDHTEPSHEAHPMILSLLQGFSLKEYVEIMNVDLERNNYRLLEDQGGLHIVMNWDVVMFYAVSVELIIGSRREFKGAQSLHLDFPHAVVEAQS